MIRIPLKLAEAIHQNIDISKGFNAMQLRESYQANKDHQGMYSTYLMSRMPATYAAITRVLQEIPEDVRISKVLDIGSGPGTGLWAVKERFPEVDSYIGLEADRTFIDLAERLNSGSVQKDVQWVQGLYPKDLPNIKADLVLLSYTIGENSLEILHKTLENVWNYNVSEWLVVIEAGTPKGYNSILNVRDSIIEKGGYIYAPCKGNYLCPLVGEDWCHFSIRLERTLLQKKVKNGTLPYEDEKFSYVIARKSPVEFNENDARIIKKPVIRSGHITLDVCADGLCERKTVAKSQKETYQRAKKSEWGDSFDRDK